MFELVGHLVELLVLDYEQFVHQAGVLAQFRSAQGAGASVCFAVGRFWLFCQAGAHLSRIAQRPDDPGSVPTWVAALCVLWLICSKLNFTALWVDLAVKPDGRMLDLSVSWLYCRCRG